MSDEITGQPLDNMPLPEAPASATVKLRYQGHDVMLTLRGHDGRSVLRRLDAALMYLEKTGAEPNGNGHVGDGSAPLCPTHGKPMKPSQYGGWYCIERIADDGGNGRPVYCKHKVKGDAS